MKPASTNQISYGPLRNPSQQRGFIQNRMHNFGLTLVVMGASFALYYLGLFGSVSGPLEPGRIGDSLADLGISDRHVLVICLSLMVLAITWNWIYNAVNRLTKRHMILRISIEWRCCLRRGGSSSEKADTPGPVYLRSRASIP